MIQEIYEIDFVYKIKDLVSFLHCLHLRSGVSVKSRMIDSLDLFYFI